MKSKALDLKGVTYLLMGLLNHYPEAGHNAETIIRLAEDYLEDLRENGCKDYDMAKEAVRRARQECAYWPKISQILIHVNNIKSERRRKSEEQMAYLPESTSSIPPGQLAINRERIRIIAMEVSRKISASDAERAQYVLLNIQGAKIFYT